MFRTLHFAAVTCVLAGIAALCAIALNGSFVLVFACLCFTTVAGYAMVALQQRLRRRIDRSGQALGQFMRGELHARLQPADADDEFTRLQHRMNNLLDLLDLHLRGEEAGIDLTKHAAYADKLRLSGLSDALRERADGPAAPVDATPSVGSFLQELRQQAGALLGEKPENTEAPAEEVAVPTVAPELLQRLHRQAAQASQRLQHATNQLAQRAMQPPAPEKSPLGSFAHLESGCARMAEQATVLSLNIAIEACRAPADSPLHGATETLRALSRQLQQWRTELGQYDVSSSGANAVSTVPLSVAMEALTSAEQHLRAQQDMIDELLAAHSPATQAEAA